MLIHYISTDDNIRTVQSDDPPLRDEVQRFVGGDLEIVWVWPYKKRHLMYVNERGTLDDLPLNIYATLLYHECTKYQRGLKGPGDEKHMECIEDLVAFTPLDDIPWIRGNAILLEEYDALAI